MTDIEQFYNIYNSPGKCTVLFREIKELLKAEVLKEISGNKDFSISELAEKIEFHHIDMYDFWQQLLQLRSCLTPEKLFELWFCIIADNSYTDYHEIAVDEPKKKRHLPPRVKAFIDRMERENGIRKSLPPAKPIRLGEWSTIVVKNTLNDKIKQLLNDSSLTEELMIDNPSVLYRYCQMQKRGFEMLRYACYRRAVKQRIPEKMRQAIAEDNAEAFLIYKDIAGIKLSYSMLAEIMENRAFRIFDTVIKSKNFFKRTMPIEELAACCTVQFEDSASTAFLECIENAYPGTIRNVHDLWGRNLLWYAVYNRRTAFFHPNCRLSGFLLQHGCDPDNQNQLGFSWRDMMKNLKTEQKIQLLKQRYRKQSKKYPSHLKEDQPLKMLKDKQFEPEWMKNLYREQSEMLK